MLRRVNSLIEISPIITITLLQIYFFYILGTELQGWKVRVIKTYRNCQILHRLYYYDDDYVVAQVLL